MGTKLRCLASEPEEVIALASTHFAFSAPLPGGDTISSHDVTAGLTRESNQAPSTFTFKEAQNRHQRLERRVNFNPGPLDAQQHAQQAVSHHGIRQSLVGLAASHDTGHATSIQHAQAEEAEGQSGAQHRNMAAWHQQKATGYRQEAELHRAAGLYHTHMNNAMNAQGVATHHQVKANDYARQGKTRKAEEHQDKADDATEDAANHRLKANELAQGLTNHINHFGTR
ncbi:hypothetical protein FRC16_001844 [Serendipita sp. 398]|nr:hypothetical protein FRC16_001844 [Serendipita sp. 398]KAG8808287.1 hypothetical protein FRC18_005111 [Serendipita sp. 400]